MSVWVLHCMKLPCQGGKKEVKPVLIHLASHPFSNSHQSPHGLAEALRLGSQVLSHYKASSNKKNLISKPASLTTVLNYLATPSHSISLNRDKAQTLSSVQLVLPDFIYLFLATFAIHQSQPAHFSFLPNWLKGKSHLILLRG